MPDQTHDGSAARTGNPARAATPGNPYDVPTTPATGRVIFGWALVGVPLLYGVITTLSKVGQLFG